jgi:hypothetical protein
VFDGPGAQSFMTHNPHRGSRNWSAGSAFRPTFVRLRSSPGGWRRRERSPLVPPLAPRRPQVAGWAPAGRHERRRAKVGATATSSSPPSSPSVRSQSADVTNQPPCAQLGLRRKGLEFGPNRDWRLRAPLGAEVLISNKSPMRCPKSFGGFHLPTVAAPPSVFAMTRRRRRSLSLVGPYLRHPLSRSDWST